MRRALITIAASLVLISLDFYPAYIPLPWPSTRNVEAEPSGATSPAPVNASFEAPVDAATLASPAAALGRIEPPGWRITQGTARPERADGQRPGRSDGAKAYAVLDQGEATLVSSPFTLTSTARTLAFEYKFFRKGARPNALRLYVLDGPAFQRETEAATKVCDCETGWETARVDVSAWAGQTIKLKFVRSADSAGPIGIDEVAQNLLEAKIGRQRASASVADPVNTSTGNFYISETDLMIPAEGPGLSVARNYNSESTFVGDFGRGWSWLWDMTVTLGWVWDEITQQAYSYARDVRYPDGKLVTFTRDDYTIQYRSSANFDILDCGNGSGNSCTLFTRSQLRYVFSPAGSNQLGELQSIIDRQGNSVSYSREWIECTGLSVNIEDGTMTCISSVFHPAEITDSAGRKLAVDDDNGRVASIRDPLGFTAYFTYDGSNGSNGGSLLTQFTDFDGTVTSYGYTNNLLTSVTTAGVTKVQNVYDAAGRVVEQTDAVGGVTCLKYGSAPSYTSASCPAVDAAPQAGQTVVVDPRGNKTTYDFNVDFNTVQVKDANNGVSSFTYGAKGTLVCATNPLGKKVSRSYDDKGNVSQLIDPLNTNSSCGLASGGVKWTFAFSFDSSGSKNEPDLFTDPLGRQADYSFGASGIPTTVVAKDAGGVTKGRACFAGITPNKLTEVTISTTLTDCTGNTAKFEYDAYGNLTGAIDPRFSGQSTPPKETLTYNGDGRPLTVTNELGHTTTLTYDSKGRVLTEKNALNQTTTYTYDARGNLKTVTDPLGKVTTYNYDGADRLTSVVDAANGTTSYAYDANGNTTSVTNPRGKVTTYAYDALNRVTSTTDPNNRTASFQYDVHSRVTQRSDARGLVTKYFYDATDRLTRAEHWNGATFVDQVTYAYDALGNRTQMVDPTGTTAYAYDALNRATSVTFPGNKVVSYQYDNAGRRTRITYPDAKTVDYGYDAASNLTSVTDWASRLTAYAYDNAGNLTTTTLPSASGLSSTRTYDNAERLTQVTNLGTWRSMIVTAHDFSSSATWTPPTGMAEALDVASKAVPNAGGISIEANYAVQDAAGATGTKTATASGDTDWGNTHILALRPASVTGATFRSASSAGADDSVLSLTINKPAGTTQNDVMIASVSVRPSSATVTAPSGWTLIRRTDNANSPTNSLAVYRKVAGASEPSSYAWTFSTATGSAGGIQSFSGVDTANPISAESGQTTASGLSHATPSIDVPAFGSTISSFTYTLNAAGARTQVVDGSGTTTYAYDNLYRLTGVTYPGPTTDTYTYDANGNRLTKNATAYTYDNADQMLTAAGVNYGYDANGNQTSRGSDTFAWDFENRMTAATVSGTATTYTYNGDGLRQSRASGGVASSYTWDVNRGLPVILQDTTASATTTYVYGLGMLYWVDGSGNPTYRLTDGLGSTANLANGSGNVTDSWTYDVFGAVRTHSGANGTEFTFTGEQNDPNGLEYLRARYYDPASGRFLGQDPLGGGYGYAGGNPVNFVDPTGLYTICGDNPAYGYICFDSTQVGLSLCSGDTVESCGRYQGDGSAPGNVEYPIYCNAGLDACVMPNGDVYGAHHIECFDLYQGEDTCNAYLGNLLHPRTNVKAPTSLGPPYCFIWDLNCDGIQTPAEKAFLDAAYAAFCSTNPATSSCGGSAPDPRPTPPPIAGNPFLNPMRGACDIQPDFAKPVGC